LSQRRVASPPRGFDLTVEPGDGWGWHVLCTFVGMKYTAVLALCVVLLGCNKDESVNPNEPTAPITRLLYADFVGVDTSAMRVVIDRATQNDVPYAWKQSSGDTFVLCTLGGNQGNVYRNDRVMFICNTTAAADVTVRLDDIQTFAVHLDPAQNGQVVREEVLHW
jgi:hypothetical protein